MLNHVIVMGRLVRDPELRRTQSGTAVTSVRIAVDRDFKDQSGEKQADFFDVVAWKSAAEFVAKHFSKGRMAVVEGRLQTREWTDRSGNKRVTTEIVADTVYFADSKQISREQQEANFDRLAESMEQFAEVPEDGELPF